MGDERARSRWSRRLPLLLFVLVGLVRIGLSTRAPVETSDLLRNLGYGRAFWQQGLALYDAFPAEVAGGRGWAALWHDHSYDYPAVTLLFFALLAGISTSLVWAKLMLSALELVNAALVFRVTGSRWLALAWFASPASLWWISHEGQFEPLVATFTLLAIDALRRGRLTVAWLALALAIQAKLFPVFLLPLFLARASSARGLLAFAAGFLPSLVAVTRGSYLLRMFEPGYWPSGFNGFDWRFWSTDPFQWIPPWLISWNAILSYGLLGVALYHLLHDCRRKGFRAALGALPLVLFLIFLKSMGWGQFWYLLLAPALALAVDPPEARRTLFLMALLEGRGSSALFVGPVDFRPGFDVSPFLHGGA